VLCSVAAFGSCESGVSDGDGGGDFPRGRSRGGWFFYSLLHSLLRWGGSFSLLNSFHLFIVLQLILGLLYCFNKLIVS
jgi:hypothetical protein